MMRRFALASAILIAAGSACPAMAGSATSNINVSSNVPANCIISTGSLSFGAYDPIVANVSNPVDATATITTTCTGGATATITIGQGNNAATNSTDESPKRRLIFSTSTLNYYLYQDSERNTPWGNTPGTGVSVNGVATPHVTTVYGRIPSGQNAGVGSHSDTVTATVSF